MGLNNEDIDKMLLEIVKNLPDISDKTNTSSQTVGGIENNTINTGKVTETSSAGVQVAHTPNTIPVKSTSVPKATPVSSVKDTGTVNINNNDPNFNPFSRKYIEEQKKKEQEELHKYSGDKKYQYNSEGDRIKQSYAPLIVVRKSKLKNGEITFNGDTSYPIISTKNAKELYTFQFGYADMFEGYDSERYVVVGYVERQQIDSMAVPVVKTRRGGKEIRRENPTQGQVKYIATWFPQYKGSRACSRCDGVWWAIDENGSNSVDIVMAGVDCSEWQGIDALDTGLRVDEDGNLYNKNEQKVETFDIFESSKSEDTDELLHDKEVGEMTFGGMKVQDMYLKMMDLAQQVADITSGEVDISQWRANRQKIENESANVIMRDDVDEMQYNNNVFQNTHNWLKDKIDRYTNTISEDEVENRINKNSGRYGEEIVKGKPNFRRFRRTGKESDYIQDFAGFTKSLVLDVMDKFGGLNRIREITVMDDGSILFNNQLYKPHIEEEVIASLPSDIQRCVESGGVAQIYDWTSMSGMRNLRKFSVEGGWSDFVLYTLAPQYQSSASQFRIDHLFDYLPPLQEINYMGEKITRSNRDEYLQKLSAKERPIAIQKIDGFATNVNDYIYKNMTVGGIKRYKDIWTNPNNGIIKKSFYTVFNTVGVVSGATANFTNFVARDIINPVATVGVDMVKKQVDNNNREVRRAKGNSAYEKFKQAMRSDKF